jgi:serine/threonine protein kinase/Tfp pilus assembly protein PilF
MSADRNLLFGILALQMDFIDRDQLVRAMHVWILQKHKPLGEILVEERALVPTRCALLESLVDEYVQAHSSDPQQSLAALSMVSSVREELSRITDRDVQASVRAVGTSDPHATRPPSVGTPSVAGQRFRVLRPHATGGLGQVSVALDEELRRQVALKEIRPEQAHDSANRARFLLEAEVTGQLEHPGVIPVYGLGHYADGRPFYAMRFVKGDNLREAVARFHRKDKQGMPAGEWAVEFRRLLGRFVDVCQAIAYAHSKGVLHRDLKPHNILLGPYGETLVIDWGLAKLFEPARGELPGTEAVADQPLTVFEVGGVNPTVLGQVVGTPGYMSPEQAAGELGTLGPASDVYGLGATLYALLTGRAPVEGRDHGEVLRRVRQGDFPHPRTVQPEVPTALEAICLKSMALRPADRYESALALAADVEHWLADEPVSAYPEPLATRTGRWVRRHRTAVAAAAVLLLTAVTALSIGVVLLSGANARTRTQYDRAEEAAARAGAVSSFLTEMLAEATPEKHARAKQVTVEEVLDQAAAKSDKGFPGQPLVEADVRLAVGSTYWRLGLHDKAQPHLERSLALRRERLGPDHPDTLAVLGTLAVLFHSQGKLAEAEQAYRQSLEAFLRVSGPDHLDTLATVGNLARVLQDQGKLKEAERLYLQNLDAYRRLEGPNHPDTLLAVNNLAALFQDEGKMAEAERLFRQNLESYRRQLGPDHPDALKALHNLASFLQDQGKLAEAEPLLRQSVEGLRRVEGPDHPNTLAAAGNLALLLHDQGKLAEAERLYRQCLEGLGRVSGPDHPNTLTMMHNLARLLQDQGKLVEAEQRFRQCYEARRRVLGAAHPETLLSLYSLASVLADQGKLVEAERLAREALELARKGLPAGHPRLLGSLAILGSVLTEAGKASEAEPVLRECLAGRRKDLPPGHPRTAWTESVLGACLAAQKKYAEAEPLLLGGYQVLAKDPGTLEDGRRRARERLVRLYEAWGKPDEAARWK